MRLCAEIRLTIPDNEAETAAATLLRLAVPLKGLERADLYLMEAEEDTDPEALCEALRQIETIFNPNKHALRLRGAAPDAGEVWIHERPHAAPPEEDGPVRIAGRVLAGVRRIERFTLWRLLESSGAPAANDLVVRATETLLCNPAFQVASTR